MRWVVSGDPSMCIGNNSNDINLTRYVVMIRLAITDYANGVQSRLGGRNKQGRHGIQQDVERTDFNVLAFVCDVIYQGWRV